MPSSGRRISSAERNQKRAACNLRRLSPDRRSEGRSRRMALSGRNVLFVPAADCPLTRGSHTCLYYNVASNRTKDAP